ncbi:MAG: response regulator [Janthinobacterium lividum]
MTKQANQEDNKQHSKQQMKQESRHEMLLKGARIVIIEDDNESRESLLMALEEQGATVAPACDAEDGVEVVLRESPEIVICDIGLPGMDGYYLIQRLRDHEQSHGLKPAVAIALTGRTDEVDRLRSVGEGFQHFISKPTDPYVVIDKIVTALDAQR